MKLFGWLIAAVGALLDKVYINLIIWHNLQLYDRIVQTIKCLFSSTNILFKKKFTDSDTIQQWWAAFSEKFFFFLQFFVSSQVDYSSESCAEVETLNVQRKSK